MSSHGQMRRAAYKARRKQREERAARELEAAQLRQRLDAYEAKKQAEYAANRAAIIRARAFVAAGKCPRCGGGELVRDLSSAGWWRCGSRERCEFQTFTE